MSFCPSVRLSRRLTAAAAAGGFAAEVGRGQQISTDSCCRRATCGPRKFRVRLQGGPTCLFIDGLPERERESARDQRAYRLSATWAAMTRCRSTTSRQFAHWQSFQRHWRLCPFRHDTTPWLRHRAHLGVRSSRLDDVLEGPPPSAARPAAAVDDQSCTPTGTFVSK